jgi:hypothetical protein
MLRTSAIRRRIGSRLFSAVELLPAALENKSKDFEMLKTSPRVSKQHD